MIDYASLYQSLCDLNAGEWANRLPQQINQALDPSRHGNLTQWERLINQAPSNTASERILDADTVKIGSRDDLSVHERTSLESQLMSLSPWRKGPFELFGVTVDAEWRSDWKWRRIAKHLSSLKNRTVLDVGCGNGYYCWRMLGAGAKLVVGIDPMLLHVVQFHFIRKLYGDPPPLYVLPLGIEDLPYGLKLFDSVFSMGVLYHRRSPIDHLLELRDCLIPGGELILETLIIDGGAKEALVPEDRYAKMRNVWFLPSCPALLSWLKRCGFKNVRLVDVTPTTVQEQRSTTWMTFQSLQDYLNPQDSRFTSEGYPAPKRAIIIAQTANS